MCTFWAQIIGNAFFSCKMADSQKDYFYAFIIQDKKRGLTFKRNTKWGKNLEKFY